MRRKNTRVLSLFLMLALLIGLLSGISLPAEAATVDYVYSGKYIYNWGHRGTTATFLSPNAEAFYQDNHADYSELAALEGSAELSKVPASDLYRALQQLMASNHSHRTDYGETRNLYKYTDCQDSAQITTTISSFYSGIAVGPAWDSGKTWNREHTWPNSKGLAGDDENDIMMLRPTSIKENSSRGNKAYGEGSGYYDPNNISGGALNLHGDVARIFLYTYVRWGNTNGNGKYTAWGTNGVMESVDVLLRWMEEDPVDTWELGRNDSVEAITGTRNVFVDYPELAFLLFGREVPTNMSTPSGEAAKEPAGCRHENTSTTPAVAPSCTETGLTEGLYCNDCDTYLSGHETLSATGHSYTAVVTPPTETEDGYTTHTCENCGHTYTDSTVPALGCQHSQTTITGGYDPTCTENGYTGDTVCVSCGKVLVIGTPNFAPGHTLTAVPEKPATTESTGLAAHQKCSVCGERFNQAGDPVFPQDLILEKLEELPEKPDNTAKILSGGGIALLLVVGALVLLLRKKK